MKKQITIRSKITLWYSMLTIALVVVMMVYLYFAMNSFMSGLEKQALVSDSQYGLSTIHYADGKLSVKDSHINTDLLFSVYDDAGNEIYNTIPRGVTLQKNFHYETITSEKTGDKLWFAYDVPVLYNDEQVGSLRVVRTQTYYTGVLYELLLVLGTFVPIYIACAVIIGYLLVRRAFRPLDSIHETALKISAGDMSQRIGITSNDEIGALSSTIDEMLGLIQSSFQKEKQFATNASHELRTPLAVIMAHAEDALDGKKSEAEYREALYMIYSKSKEMSDMVTRFLDYARNKEKTMQLEKTNMSATIMSVIDEMRAAFSEFEIIGNIQENVYMMADQMLIARLAMNLLDNAFKYGKKNGRVIVSLTKNKGGITLRVEDNGKGISRSDIDRIFHRHYSSQSKEKSYGVGLSLVKWIVNIHGGTISAKNRPGHGGLFEIHFPTQ